MGIKEAYYESVTDIMHILTPKQQSKIYVLNRFEYASILFKEKKYKLFLAAALGIFRYPSTFFAAINRVFSRILGTKFKNYYVNRYKPGKTIFGEVK